jgi:hypothetical protein
LLERNPGSEAELARAEFVEARALVAAGRPLADALVQARRARDTYQRLGRQQQQAEIAGWLKDLSGAAQR